MFQFFDRDNGIIKPHGVDLFSHLLKRKQFILIRVPRMNCINESLGILNETGLVSVTTAKPWPVAGVAIVHHIEPTVLQMRPQPLKTGDLVGADMTTVIKDYIKRAKFLDQSCKKLWVSLIELMG